MKIWVIGRDYPEKSNLMWGLFELEQAKLLAKYNNNVSYIAVALNFTHQKKFEDFRQFEEDGVNIYVYSHFYFPGKLGFHLKKIEEKYWEKIMEKVLSYSGLPDLIHIHYPTMIGSINVIEKYRKKGVKIFVTEHWSRVLINALSRYERKRMVYYATYANCFFSVGVSLQDAIKKAINVKVPMVTMPNMVSPLFFLDNNPVVNKEFTFIMVGRLTEVKQFDVVIAHFIHRFEKNANVILKIVGSGKDIKKLKKISGNNSQIIFTGALSPEDVAKEIMASNALISYSKYETFGVPVIEAWACGKPIITTANSGVAAYVNNDIGIIVQHNKPEQLEEAMWSLFENIDKYNSFVISDFAKKNFGGEALYRRLQYFYRLY